MSEYNDGGYADRGNTPGSNVGGVAQPGGPNSSSSSNQNSPGTGTAGHGTSSFPFPQTTNFSSAYGKPSVGTGSYGITPFNVPRKDQTLQDRQFGHLGQGMVGTDFGGPGTTQGGNPSPGIAGQPVRRQQFRTTRRRNPVTGVVETIQVPVPQPAPILPQNYGFVNPYPGYHIPQPPAPPEPIIHKQNYGFLGDQTIPEDQPPPEMTQSPPNYNWGADPHGYGFGSTTGNNASGAGTGAGTGANANPDPPDPNSAGSHGMRFGGEAMPGQTYTVGENGPETLMMGQNGGGQVIPHNPMDRLGSIDPRMMQQFYQLMQQHMMKKQAPAQGMQPPMPQRPQMSPPPGPPRPGPPRPGPGGGFQGRPMGTPQMGIAGLSRPQQAGGGYGWGGSGLGQSGIMPQLAGQNRVA